MKIRCYLFAMIIFFSCNIKNTEKYIDSFKPNSMDLSVGPDEGVHTGFLKDDIKVKTPYGNITAAAVGHLSGYLFDFAFYKNGNINMLWPKNRINILIDEMDIIVPAYNEGEVAIGIEFHDNFMLRFCTATNQITVAGVQIPAWSYLHFYDNEKIRSFVTRNRWTFMDIEYPAFQEYYVVDNKIIPK